MFAARAQKGFKVNLRRPPCLGSGGWRLDTHPTRNTAKRGDEGGVYKGGGPRAPTAHRGRAAPGRARRAGCRPARTPPPPSSAASAPRRRDRPGGGRGPTPQAGGGRGSVVSGGGGWPGWGGDSYCLFCPPLRSSVLLSSLVLCGPPGGGRGRFIMPSSALLCSALLSSPLLSSPDDSPPLLSPASSLIRSPNGNLAPRAERGWFKGRGGEAPGDPDPGHGRE